MAPNRARRIFVPTNPDLADILGRMNLNFDIFVNMFLFFGNFQVHVFPFSGRFGHALAADLLVKLTKTCVNIRLSSPRS